MFTRAHKNRYWTVFLQVVVLAHGTLVAIMQGNGIWPMFFFGFGGIFVITQMHGLGLSRILRGLILGCYVVGAIWIYSGRGLETIHEIIRIPIIDYLGVLVLSGLLSLGLWVTRRLRAGTTPVL